MPLLDHFRAPLHPQHHWEALHSRWANAIADLLNEELLPADYFAEPETHAGARVEIDVATFDERFMNRADTDRGGVATLPVQTWSPPAATLRMPATFPGRFQVQIFRNEGGAVLVGAIELVSPGHKDREPERRAFATKCANYLYQAIGLVIVDVVTNRHGNLHNEVIRLMEREEHFLFGGDDALYSTGYRPFSRGQADIIEIWPFALALGSPLPTVPLFLRGGLCLPVDLETTYGEACRRLRLQ